MADDRYTVILAGGSGTRFWPLSRHRRPKQLLQLFDNETLIEKTLNRLEGVVPPENILILTNAEQIDELRSIVTQLPAENILAEPAKRDTAPAVALGAGWVAKRNPEATMAVLPADHLIQDEAGFREVLDGTMEIAEKSPAVVTIGIRPTWACPSYGYIERGNRATISGLKTEVAAYEVKRFREKPDSDLAAYFLEQGHYTWNAGMFIWSIPTLLSELSFHAPELAEFIKEIRESKDLEATLAHQFPRLPRISIDYALMEKASRVLNVEATFDWDDVGGWPAVAAYLHQDENHNSTRGEVTQVDSHDNIIYSTEKHRIATLGVHNLIIVQTGDAILVADRDRADSIKKLVDQLPSDVQ